MAPRESGRYTAPQLAQLTGVSERTVRYYVQERLIDPPKGRGPGAHFDERHLSQLRRVRVLQEAGLDHDSIRLHGETLERTLAKRGIRLKDAEHAWGNFALQATAAYRAMLKDWPKKVATSTVTRVRITPGVDLFVDGSRRMPPPRQLLQVVRLLRSAFSDVDEEDADNGHE